MKRKLFAGFLVLATAMFIYLPTMAKAAAGGDDGKTNVVETVTAKAVRDVRYVRIRGKRYKVWYKTYYRNGRRYVRIQRIRRA